MKAIQIGAAGSITASRYEQEFRCADQKLISTKTRFL